MQVIHQPSPPHTHARTYRHACTLAHTSSHARMHAREQVNSFNRHSQRQGVSYSDTVTVICWIQTIVKIAMYYNQYTGYILFYKGKQLQQKVALLCLGEREGGMWNGGAEREREGTRRGGERDRGETHGDSIVVITRNEKLEHTILIFYVFYSSWSWSSSCCALTDWKLYSLLTMVNIKVLRAREENYKKA